MVLEYKLKSADSTYRESNDSTTVYVYVDKLSTGTYTRTFVENLTRVDVRKNLLVLLCIGKRQLDTSICMYVKTS